MTPVPVIEARGLRKTYGGAVALDRIDFTAQPGRIVGLMGPNGAGKTTALKAILGLTDFDGDPVHTGPGIIAAADEETHAAPTALVSRHRTD